MDQDIFICLLFKFLAFVNLGSVCMQDAFPAMRLVGAHQAEIHKSQACYLNPFDSVNVINFNNWLIS